GMIRCGRPLTASHPLNVAHAQVVQGVFEQRALGGVEGPGGLFFQDGDDVDDLTRSFEVDVGGGVSRVGNFTEGNERLCTEGGNKRWEGELGAGTCLRRTLCATRLRDRRRGGS